MVADDPAGIQSVSHPAALPDLFNQPLVRPERASFLQFRDDLLLILEDAKKADPRLIGDIADALVDSKGGIPTTILRAGATALTLGGTVRKRRKERTIARLVVDSMLQQIFDPTLDFQMTVHDIRDAYQSAGAVRDSIQSHQIQLIYVRCEQALKVGGLRHLILERGLEQYINVKLIDIQESRREWTLNNE